MSALVTREELEQEFSVALSRVTDCARNSIMSDQIRPVTVALSEVGETLTITAVDTSDVFDGGGELYIELNVPWELVGEESIEPTAYARELYESEALAVVTDVLDSKFDVEASFMASESTGKAVTFSELVPLSDPSNLPTDDDHEIVPVVTVDVEKKWVYKRTDRSTVTAARESDVDMVIRPTATDDERDVEFGESIPLFGADLTVENTDAGLALMDGDDVKAYISGFSGDWRELVGAGGEYAPSDR